MANPEHVEIVKRGKEAIEAWRKAHPNEWLDLSGADLHEAYLVGTNLRGADLREADLVGAHLGGANLMRTNFKEAYLILTKFYSADLSRANLALTELKFANFGGANLSGTNLSGADLWQTTFSNTMLSGANFESALLDLTIFAGCDLSEARNLEKTQYKGPSTIGIDTILRSGGNIPEEFLRGAGVPEEIIGGLRNMIGEIQYLSCFIAYGEPDKAFAERLHKSLTSKGVNSWLYSLDSTSGEPTWREISQKRREADKFIVLCSAPALVRGGVRKEIEEQMDEDPDKIMPISLDGLWKEPGFSVLRDSRDLKPFIMERNYANFEKSTAYRQGLIRLLKALERKRD